MRITMRRVRRIARSELDPRASMRPEFHVPASLANVRSWTMAAPLAAGDDLRPPVRNS
jgi:hypothetical protein